MHTETKSIHAGHQIDSATGAVTPPIYLSTTFARQADGEYPHGYVYTRDNNPNRELLEARVASLEGGVGAAAFASGSVATMSILQALTPNDHIIAPNDLYFGIRLVIEEFFVPWGLQVSFVDTTDVAAVQTAIRPDTKLILVETPSNPLIKITDIRRVAEAAHAANALLMVDNTIPTPILQRPLELGADLVVHAATKYISGHSDVLGGVIVTNADSELWQKIVKIQKVGGAVPSPFDCWLALRGIQTLPCRIRTQSESALQIARYLAEHSAVERVHYPGLQSHSGHQVAGQQMSHFGALLSIQVKGGQPEAMAVAANVKLFTRATSFGGTHSLIEHRASVEAPDTKTPPNLLRLSIGLENVTDLVEDLAQSLALS